MTRPENLIYRHIVDVLLAEHETDQTPRPDLYPPKLISCVWGIYCYIHRLARAAVKLDDDGMNMEANVLARVMLEHTLVLHWIIERGDDGVDAMNASQARQMKRWISGTEGTELFIPAAIADEIVGSFTGIDESVALQTFRDLCKQIDAESLYTVYGALSGHVHPTITTSNMFLCPDGRLSPEPLSGYSCISIMAHCLIWSERDLDRITPGTPKTASLEKLAAAIKARPCLPPYRAIGPAARRGKRKGN